ncbi:MAG TPA: hypothetical protein VIX89_16065 [Bryobacteraceae bacterium]
MELLPAVDNGDSTDSRNTLLMFGGLALVTLGAGMILTSPAVRKYLSGFSVGKLLQAAGPDFERYMKLRAM